MGAIVKAQNYSSNNEAVLLKPIIFCCSYKDAAELAVCLNKEISEKLIRYKPQRRTIQIDRCFSEVISQFPDGVVIKDFDVLFNPEYKIDVLKMLVDACKTKPFSILWPGKLTGTKLTYAEENYKDYKVYDINNYDVTCIV